jgi:hypothetical protein
MRYLVLASDFDGTLAHDAIVDQDVILALERCRDSGRRLVMVTGRELADLVQVFERLDLFEYVVVENGATLFHPETGVEKSLVERPPEEFIRTLESRGVTPISVGTAIVATLSPHETTVLQTIHDFGLELQVIFNKGAVMILPSGVNKATGLKAALAAMGVSRHNVVSVGDAENDHALLGYTEAGVAIADAVPTLLQRADLVTNGTAGFGVIELVDRLIASDLTELEPRLTRHHILLGEDLGGKQVDVPPYGLNILISGTSSSGKSTLAAALLERLSEQHYQICVIDPEGDYEKFLDATLIGSAQEAPSVDAVVRVLEDPRHSVVVNMHGVPLEDRPRYFQGLLARLEELRNRTGHPHWIVVDEAHHVLPSSWEPSALHLPQHMDRMLFITLENPDLLAPAVLSCITTVLVTGREPEKTLQRFAAADHTELPTGRIGELQPGQALHWSKKNPLPFVFKVTPGKLERRRHSRKYAEGDLGPDRSFYFRGPEAKLNLRAQNLITFLQMAEGVDDETWLHHLRQGEYSKWFRERIKDPNLADAAADIEHRLADSVSDSRAAIKSLVEEHYTLPGGPAQRVVPRNPDSAH